MLPAILQGAQAAFQIGTGIAQLIKGGKMRPVRPGYDFEAMNRGQLENRNMFMNAMNAGMPGLQNQMKGIDTSKHASKCRQVCYRLIYGFIDGQCWSI
jgi:hypothetical protein